MSTNTTHRETETERAENEQEHHCPECGGDLQTDEATVRTDRLGL